MICLLSLFCGASACCCCCGCVLSCCTAGMISNLVPTLSTSSCTFLTGLPSISPKHSPKLALIVATSVGHSSAATSSSYTPHSLANPRIRQSMLSCWYLVRTLGTTFANSHSSVMTRPSLVVYLMVLHHIKARPQRCQYMGRPFGCSADSLPSGPSRQPIFLCIQLEHQRHQISGLCWQKTSDRR